MAQLTVADKLRELHATVHKVNNTMRSDEEEGVLRDAQVQRAQRKWEMRQADSESSGRSGTTRFLRSVAVS